MRSVTANLQFSRAKFFTKPASEIRVRRIS